jgi:trigger factor
VEVTINSISEVEHEADITVGNEELQPHFERAYLDYRPTAEVKGFRKGKVPLHLIKRMFGETIEYQSLDTVATDLYRQAMLERDIHPIGRPSMIDMDFKRGQHFRFKIKYEVKPVIELNTYKGLVIERPVHPVTDAEVEAEITRLRRANSTHTEVSKVSNSEHVVTGDVQELDESGAPLIGKKSSNVRFFLGDENLPQEIKDALGAAEAGGTYRANVPSRRGETSQTARFAITVTRVEQEHLPAFDDDFVTKITGGKTTTATEFLATVRSDIERFWEEQAERSVADSIVSELIRTHTFPVPESLITSVLDALVEDVKGKTRDRQLPRDFDERTFREENRSYATWQAKWMLLKERIAEAEQMTVTDNDIEQLAERDTGQTGIDKARLLQYYKSSSAVADRILSGKVMTFLRQQAIVTDKVAREPLVQTT